MNTDNKCIRCGMIAIAKAKDSENWYCIAHAMEYADIKSGKYLK
jgi:hypothetical protein